MNIVSVSQFLRTIVNHMVKGQQKQKHYYANLIVVVSNS